MFWDKLGIQVCVCVCVWERERERERERTDIYHTFLVQNMFKTQEVIFSKLLMILWK